MIGPFIPVVMVTFYNRSWCFMCCAKRSSSPSVEIDGDDKNEKLIATDADDQTGATLLTKEQEIEQLKKHAESLKSSVTAIEQRVQSVRDRIAMIEEK